MILSDNRFADDLDLLNTVGLSDRKRYQPGKGSNPVEDRAPCQCSPLSSPPRELKQCQMIVGRIGHHSVNQSDCV